MHSSSIHFEEKAAKIKGWTVRVQIFFIMIVDEFSGKKCCVKQKTENREHIANPPSGWAGNKDITELICRRMLLFNVISNKPFIKFIAAPDTHSCVPAYKFSQNRLFCNFWKLYTPDYKKWRLDAVRGKLTVDF